MEGRTTKRKGRATKRGAAAGLLRCRLSIAASLLVYIYVKTLAYQVQHSVVAKLQLFVVSASVSNPSTVQCSHAQSNFLYDSKNES